MCASRYLLQSKGCCIALLAWVGGRSLAGFNCCDLSLPDAELIEVLKQSVKIRNPQDQDDDDQAIQDRFDLSLHRDESVHKPQQDACCNNREEDSGKWHIGSPIISRSRNLQGIVEKVRAFVSP